MRFLSPDIIADENISVSIINSLRSAGYKVLSVKTDSPGAKDSDIIRIAAENYSVVLTEDRDFGEWVFSHKVKSSGILYLRYEYNDRTRIIEMLLSVLEKYSMSLYDKFTVITSDRIRVREL
jgi:predicted nuclease of predicted toxin-antitoxin system